MRNRWLDALARPLRDRAAAYAEATDLVREVRNPRVLADLLPSAARGFVARRGKQGVPTRMASAHETHFDWAYATDQPQLRELYRRAKQNQWDAEQALAWATDVDPDDPERSVLPGDFFPAERLSKYGFRPGNALDMGLRYDLACWMLSQFLHGEQGALHAAAQVAECVPWTEGKLYAATQVMDEARHVEVFHRYLETKLNKLYAVNDNLFVILDALVHDARWDMKFLGMQLLVEGLALGAFSTLYKVTREPLLASLLRRVIQDEARHVHFGVVALREYYQRALPLAELRERQDWAFEVSLLMRNRFMAHEIYEERFEGLLSRRSWNELVRVAPGFAEFRRAMFGRLLPNLRYVGLLDERMASHYEAAGLLVYAAGKHAAELSGDEMIAELDAASGGRGARPRAARA